MSADVRVVLVAQRGQSLSEFLIVTVLLLIPLFLMIPVLGATISQKQDVELGARYAAWEYTVWHRSAPEGPGTGGTVKGAQQIAAEVDARLLSQDDAPVVSDSDISTELDPFARLVTTGESIIRNQSPGASNARYSRATLSAEEPAAGTRAADDALAAFGAFTRFDLERRGVTEADLSIDLIDLSSIFDVGPSALANLTLHRRNALFTEAWTGGTTERTEYLISGLTPQQYFDNPQFRAAQQGFAQQPYGQELGPEVLIPGHSDIEPLPDYRLGTTAP